ncbi:SsgA family sporulation/cell division regulator [Streptomyces sp. NPDC005805]|uniref:SsgA family sporulation/cell division regulator n=1 Tax=Streptomyces sp. NPDC005805 TaxID=3157068 RepID=UPI00340A2F0A
MADDWHTAPRAQRAADWQTHVQQIHPAGSAPVEAVFRYTADDPFAARVEFRRPGLPPVTWFMARDLLVRGVRVLSGTGEVRLRPVPGPGRDGVVHLRLGTPRAHALFVVDRSGLSRWLDRTFALVPRGAESSHVDWDAVTGRLLPATEEG